MAVEAVANDKIYVAVGKEVKESESTLVWALKNSGGKEVCILHIHLQAQRINVLGAKFPSGSLKKEEVGAYRELERQAKQDILKEYLHICTRAGIQAEILCTEADSVEKGIVALVSQHGIMKLVMGAAADKLYSKKKMRLKSKKAIYVNLKAPESCHIWFICKGNLIETRKGSCSLLQSNPSSETVQSNRWGSQSIQSSQSNPGQFPIRRIMSVHCDISRDKVIQSPSSDGTGVLPTAHVGSDAEGRYVEWDRIISSNALGSSSNSQASHPSASSSSSEVVDSALIINEASSIDEVHYHLVRSTTETEKSMKVMREAFEESVKHRKVERDAIDALVRKTKDLEILYAEERKRRIETEEILAKEKDVLEKMKYQEVEIMEELSLARDQILRLKNQNTESVNAGKEMEEKIFSAVNLMTKYKKELDELKGDRDTSMPRVFSIAEIEEATNDFDPSLKIGEGGFGVIYKGTLCHTDVAIKKMHPRGSQGPSEFQQEVKVLSKLRHPNLITLIGTCSEVCALVYKYMSNGSLADRLTCKDNTPPLSWQTRIRISSELCAALTFLHSCIPQGVVHGDVKPSNILLDANFTTKLSDFGISRLIFNDQISSNNTTFYCRTNPKGTYEYMDPEFYSSGELTLKSDVYSFGIILLQLLTGKSAFVGMTKEVRRVLDEGKLNELLDSSAGEWPFEAANQFVRLALWCSERDRRSRPDIGSDVRVVLESMRDSCAASPSFRSVKEKSE